MIVLLEKKNINLSLPQLTHNQTGWGMQAGVSHRETLHFLLVHIVHDYNIIYLIGMLNTCTQYTPSRMSEGSGDLSVFLSPLGGCSSSPSLSFLTPSCLPVASSLPSAF